MEAIVRAVDAGRGNIKFVISDDDDDIKCMHFPSEAYPAEREKRIDVLSGKRATVGIPIGGLIYEVGPEAHMAADIFNAKVLQHDAYFETTEYLALVRGALHFMNVDHIDLLVVGLPVASFKMPKRVAALEKQMTGTHDLGKGKSVTVKEARVLAQPTGALMHYGKVHNRWAELRKEMSLIIDPGAQTFDWIVTKGIQQIESKSHSLDRGMFDVLQKIADGISANTGTQFRQFEVLDAALRGGKKPVIFQQEYDIAQHLPMAKKIAEHAVGEMRRYVGDASEIKNIILVGGGAFFFRKAIKDAFPKHKIHELKDALYANVKGFQIAGRLIKAQEPKERKSIPAETIESGGAANE